MTNSDLTGQLLEGVRRFVNERLIPLEAKVAEDDAIPAEALKQMADLGLFGLSSQEGYGGLGLAREGECRGLVVGGRCSLAGR